MAKFEIPKSFFHKLYELTGDGEKYKGYMLFYIDADKNVRQVVTRQDDVILSALRKRAETFLRSMDEQESIGGHNFELNE